MKTLIIISILVAGFFLCPGEVRTQTIGEINNQGGRYVDGVGCPQIWRQGRARYGGDGYFYMVPSNTGKGALMNLDGKITQLSESGTNRPKRTRKGSKFYELYKGSGYTVKVDYTVTIHGESEDGPNNQFSIIITASKGKLVKTVTAVGYCGF